MAQQDPIFGAAAMAAARLAASSAASAAARAAATHAIKSAWNKWFGDEIKTGWL